MKNFLKIGILRETKKPPDKRVPLTPSQIKRLNVIYPHVMFIVQPSSFRCYSDQEYESLNIPLSEDLSECDILMGIKEVDKQKLIPGKTYLFFSHVAKCQPHNRELLREILKRNLKLVDFEYLSTAKGERVVAFGRFAGIVGAYNGLRALGIKTGKFNLKPAWQCCGLNEIWENLRQIRITSGIKAVVTGQGRVACGALEVFTGSGFSVVSPEKYLNEVPDIPVVCQIGPDYYTRNSRGLPFCFDHFVKNPEQYESAFLPFTGVTDILVTGHYWDPHSPVLFSRNDMKRPDFRISVIADASCDINGSVPSTLRATTMDDPFYDYDPFLEIEKPAFSSPENITVMSIDNLPGELPRDASEHFGEQLINSVMSELLSMSCTGMIERATIAQSGKLNGRFSYLEDFVAGDL